ncbi:LPXTG cell wall anchor domain-containing protein [Rothia mucilaginosa]|uniref:LPXTG cell wall anchor domain-containing protein n=1 Tax=Rothia mucilaginosa TaxID=43675 RepID=UPI00204F5306|nr:LPXTG cell wall anchor domain-containing protein [Rothia mucilaginosa]UQF83749.1 MAG: LPXTG cell wall anchor domain-containing protein [Rothia mucilaginosa]
MSKTTRRVYKIAAAAAFTAGSVAAIPATFAAEAPADQQQQVVDQKATAQTSSLPGGNATEAPKAETPKAEATQAPKAEAPKAEATEAPKAEAPTPTAPATEAPKAETPKAEAPKAEATEAPKAETPAPTAPATEAPKVEAPKTEAPKADATEAPKADATETPKAETPKAETPAPTAPATPEPTTPATPEPTTPSTPAPEAKQADPSVVIENAHFPGDAQFNTVNVVGTGFYGEKVGPGVQVSIYALDANKQVTGDAIATVSVSADQIQDGSFKTAFTVEASKLPAGASYALVAVSNPQGQPDQKLVALSSFKVTDSASPEAPKTEETPAPEAPKPETPKADETPAPVTPAPETPKADETPAPEAPKTETPKEETPAPEAPKAETPKADETPAPEAPAAPENATLTTEDASLNPNDQYNVLTFNGSGFTHESVANGVQIAIFRLDANGNITGDALATHDVPASEIVNGTFRVKVSVLAELLQPGYAYAMVATSDPNGLVHQVAVTTATVSDANNPAPTLPAATEGDNTTVRDNGDGTTSVFTAEMREDGSVVVTETRMPTSQAPKAKVGNASAATSSNSKGHTVGVSGTKGSSSASSKPQLANTGAEGVAGIAGVGAAALIAGAALMLLRRRSL